MHHPRSQQRMSLKPTPISLATEKTKSARTRSTLSTTKGFGEGAASPPRVPAEYVANLQQQIFFLERKLEAQAGGGGGLMGETINKGEAAIGLRGHFQQLEAEFAAKLRSHEVEVEALTQKCHAAQLSEARARQLVAEADKRVRDADLKMSEVRQELTAEIVGLQKELDQANLAHKATREELRELSATCAELKTFTNGARSEVRRLESRLAHEMQEQKLSFEREEAMRKELFALKQAHEALQILYDSGVAKWERRESEMLKAKDVALAESYARAEKAELSRRDAEARAEAMSVRLDQALQSESMAMSRVADTAKQLSYAEADRDAAVSATEKNKMVSVMSRMIIRKTREKMYAAIAAQERVQAGEDALNERVVHAEEIKKAIDLELAQERQRNEIVAEHYRRQDADAVAMTALNRELEARLDELTTRENELIGELRAAEAREIDVLAKLKTLQSRADLGQLLSQLRVDDLRALAETQSGVTRAINETLLPALTQAIPALAAADEVAGPAAAPVAVSLNAPNGAAVPASA